MLAMSAGSRQEMAERGRALVEAKFSWPEIARQIRAVYEWILGNGPRPETVQLN